MIRSFLTLVFSGTLCTLAHAESWEGPYIGALIGAAWLTIDETERHMTTNSKTYFHDKGEDFEFGAYAGWNWQFDNTILGIELEAVSGGKASLPPTNPSNVSTYEFKTDLAVSLLGRFGFLLGDNSHVYGLAGVTHATRTYNFFQVPPGDRDKRSRQIWGGTVGLGAEHKLGLGRLRSEIQFTKFANDRYESYLFPGYEYKDEAEDLRVRIGYSIPISW